MSNNSAVSAQSSLGMNSIPSTPSKPVPSKTIGKKMNTSTLLCLCGLCVCVSLPLNGLSPSLSYVAEELHMSPQERDLYLGGYVSIATMLGQLLGSLIAAIITDTYNRKNILLWCLMTAATAMVMFGLVLHFPTLLMLRVFSGGCQGTIVPVIFSMIGDYCSPSNRTSSSAIVGSCLGGGMMIGQLFVGFALGGLGWRLPFIVMGAVSVAMCACLVKWLVEPVRGSAEEEGTTTASESGATLTGLGTGSADSEENHLLNEAGGSRTSSRSASLNGSRDAYDNEAMAAAVVVASPIDDRDRGGLGDSELGNKLQVVSVPPLTHKPSFYTVSATSSSVASGGSGTGAEKSSTATGAGSGTGIPQKLPPMTFHTYMQTLLTPTVIVCLVQTIPQTIPWGVLSTHLHDLLHTDTHLPMHTSTWLIMVFGIGAAVGGVCGGLVGSYVYVWRKAWLPVCVSICVCVSAVLLKELLLLLQSHSHIFRGMANVGEAVALTQEQEQDPVLFYAAPMLLLCGLFAAVNGANIRVLVLNVCPPNTRGAAIATLNIVNCLGRGLGPSMADWYMRLCAQQQQQPITVSALAVEPEVALVSGSASGSGSGSGQGIIPTQQCDRQHTVQAFLNLWIVSGIIMLYAARTFAKDEERMKMNLHKARSSQSHGQKHNVSKHANNNTVARVEEGMSV